MDLYDDNDGHCCCCCCDISDIIIYCGQVFFCFAMANYNHMNHYLMVKKNNNNKNSKMFNKKDETVNEVAKKREKDIREQKIKS